MFSSGLFVVHDATRGCHDDITELTRGQKVVGPLFNVTDSNIESWRDDTDFVEATSQIDNNFTATVIINDLKFADITMLHHDLKETNDNFGRGSEEYLSLASLFGIVDAFEGRSQ